MSSEFSDPSLPAVELARSKISASPKTDLLRFVSKVQAELSARLARSASAAEIANATKLSIADVLAAQASLGRFSLLPLSSPSETMEYESVRFNLRGALARLASDQAAVLYRHHFDGVPLDAIAIQLGVSTEQIHETLAAGERKLRADFVALAIWQSIVA